MTGFGMAPEESSFVADVCKNPANLQLLQRLPQLGLNDDWLVAGSLFQTVWNLNAGRAPQAGIRDYDIFYFDASDLSEAAEAAINARASDLFADLGVTLELKNQARVHTWYEAHFGRPCPPLTSSRHGVDRFLMGSVCVAMRLRPGANDPYDIELYAPNGVQDVCNGILTPNPKVQHQGDLFRRKCADYQSRWPGLTVRLPPLMIDSLL
jgi:uncharacterized protein